MTLARVHKDMVAFQLYKMYIISELILSQAKYLTLNVIFHETHFHFLF